MEKRDLNSSIKTYKEVLGDRDVNLIVPLYQRRYVWNKKCMFDLLEDLRDHIENKKSNEVYFLNSILLANTIIGTDTPKTSTCVIDGQQRLTSLSLMLKAIKLYASTIKPKATEKVKFDGYLQDINYLIDKVLYSDTSKNNVRIELLPIDRDDYNSIINYTKAPIKSPLDKNNLLNSNFIEVYYKIIKIFKVNKDNIGTIKALNSLTDLICERCVFLTIYLSNDEMANRLFDGVNNRGIGLASCDIFKNTIFKEFCDSEGKYKSPEKIDSLWTTIVQNCSSFEEYLKHWLMAFKGKDVTKGKLSSTFINILHESSLDHIKQLDIIAKQSYYYGWFNDPIDDSIYFELGGDDSLASANLLKEIRLNQVILNSRQSKALLLSLLTSKASLTIKYSILKCLNNFIFQEYSIQRRNPNTLTPIVINLSNLINNSTDFNTTLNTIKNTLKSKSNATTYICKLVDEEYMTEEVNKKSLDFLFNRYSGINSITSIEDVKVAKVLKNCVLATAITPNQKVTMEKLLKSIKYNL